jgi:hypothetical protein
LTEEWFMLLLLYCLPLLFKVWQRSGLFYFFVILSTITGTDLGLTEEWFMSLLYFLPLLFKVWQRIGSCCCYIVYYYCLRFDRGVVLVVVLILSTISVLVLTEEWFILLFLYCLPLLFKVWQRSGSCSWYIVYHYCFRFDREMVYVVDVILSTIAL